MLYTSLPNNMKVKVRLAEQLERDADTAASVDASCDALGRANALRAEVEAYVREFAA